MIDLLTTAGPAAPEMATGEDIDRALVLAEANRLGYQSAKRNRNIYYPGRLMPRPEKYIEACKELDKLNRQTARELQSCLPGCDHEQARIITEKWEAQAAPLERIVMA